VGGIHLQSFNWGTSQNASQNWLRKQFKNNRNNDASPENDIALWKQGPMKVEVLKSFVTPE